MKAMSIGEFSETVGVSIATLRLWDRKKILVPLRTPTGQRRYTDLMIEEVLKVATSDSKAAATAVKLDY